jgi:hypothetical protein
MSVYISPRTRAIDIWRSIQGAPFVVTFKTPTGTLAAQTIRIAYDDSATEPASAAGLGAVRPLLLFGVRDHPSQSDTNMKEGYRFVYLNREYTVLDVIVLPGEIRARGEAVS